ncbi:hypothetical protein HAX54_048854 [Datura stramonium]|uniref:Uncharacterized protein n=1 Tax=Datura stramonium TaxID=4076 RepID=A0ABS8SUL0_DATST|nr:hypothetical protein [Datura stramonium]
MTSNVLTSDVQTPGKRQVTPDIQEDIDEADHFIYDHPHEATRVQNDSDDQIPNRLHNIIEREEDPEEVDHFIYGQTQQNHTPDPGTPIENPTPTACDPPDPIFVVISKDETDYESEEEPKNTTDDAHAMQLLQTFGATTSQISETQVKEVTDRHGLSPRGASLCSPGSGTGPPATRTRLKVKTRHPHD